MKKKLTLATFILLVATQCIVLNPLGLTVNREKGSDAKDRITTAAITADLLYYTLFAVGPDISILSLIAGDLTNIDDGAYYLKADVDKCVGDIENPILWIVLSPLTPIFSCDLKPADGLILGSPLPRL